MQTIRTVVSGGAGGHAVVLDMQVSRGSGDLLVTAGGTYAGTLPAVVNCTLEEGATVSGPWVEVPTVPPLTVPTGPDETTFGQGLFNFAWSQRYLRVSLVNPNSDQWAAAQVVTPPGTILF